MFLLKKLIAALILPPAGPVLLAFVGLWLARTRSHRWRRAGLWLTSLSLLGLIVLSLPIVGNALMMPLEPLPPITAVQLKQVQAIVILGGGTYANAPEYGGDTAVSATLERLRYGAILAKKSGLPLLLSAGAPYGGRAESDSMREVLERDFGVKVRWVETLSRDTAENARLSAKMLKAAGINRVALVSHAWHLPRAIPLFEHEGLRVIAAPTGFSTISPSLVENLIPNGEGFSTSRVALREYLGQIYNRIKGKL
ncbi:MAG: YdcF family protein [Sulfuritalea sp.]|nr:YdcF family protein [Sulfuritalea sp.]